MLIAIKTFKHSNEIFKIKHIKNKYYIFPLKIFKHTVHQKVIKNTENFNICHSS